MTESRLVINHLRFTGASQGPAELRFDDGLTVVWGASNTGKSFALNAIDFMLGGSDPLPDISERQEYDRVNLGITIRGVGEFTLVRSVKGGEFSLFDGHDPKPGDQPPRIMAATHDAENPHNLSNFLLNQLGFAGRSIAMNQHGDQVNLSFRQLVPLLLADETAIQARRSPVQTGRSVTQPRERSVFRLMVSGSDDSAVTPVASRKKVAAVKSAKIDLLHEMLDDVNGRIARDYADAETLPEQERHLSISLRRIQDNLDAATGSIQGLLEEKRNLSRAISEGAERRDEIDVHLARFSLLQEIYVSDLERLEALEETGFLLSIGSERDCPLCGATAEVQRHAHELHSVDETRVAANVESEKIRRLQGELTQTVDDLRREHSRLGERLSSMHSRLARVESALSDLLPMREAERSSLSEIVSVRDRVRSGLELRERQQELVDRIAEVERLKGPSKKDLPDLSLSSDLAHDFCSVVSEVLTAWRFPGERHVAFDHKTYDLIIDGKHRAHNGKGVRAITHAAFKVALLIFCRRKQLPHPGLVVLDTPLLTYRDPIASKKFGRLSPDELQLAKSPLKEGFFAHLETMRGAGQFIVFENVDLPDGLDRMTRVEVFHGDRNVKGRFGFFPAVR
jgi:hypothetical protein